MSTTPEMTALLRARDWRRPTKRPNCRHALDESETVLVAAPPKPVPLATTIISAPLHTEPFEALLGASVFGRFTRVTSFSERPRTRGRARPSRSAVRLCSLSVLILIATGCIAIVRAGLAARAERESRELVREIEQLVRVGSLSQAAEQLPLVVDGVRHYGLEHEHRGRLARIEATLYRHYDADPERLKRIESALDRVRDPTSGDAVVARALIASSVDRLELIRELERVVSTGPTDSEAEFLLGTALSRGGAVTEADHRFERAEMLEPSHLQHLAGILRHHAALGRSFEAEQVLGRMRDIGPASPWTRLAEVELVTRLKGRTSEASEIETDLPPVPRAAALFVKALSLLESKREDEALAALGESSALVHHEMPFLLDMVDRLLAASETSAARFLFESRGWFENTMGATAVEGRLWVREGDLDRGRLILRNVLERGCLDPEAGITYARSLEGAGEAWDSATSKLFDKLAGAWPERADLRSMHRTVPGSANDGARAGNDEREGRRPQDRASKRRAQGARTRTSKGRLRRLRG